MRKEGFVLIDQDKDIHFFAMTETDVKEKFQAYYKVSFNRYADGQIHNLDRHQVAFTIVPCTIEF